MAIRCPYCSFSIELKGVRPGHFHPKCPKCHEKFSLVIHTDPTMQPTVTATHDRVDATVAEALGIKDSKPTGSTPASSTVPKKRASAPVVASTQVGATSVPVSATSVPSARPAFSPRIESVVAGAEPPHQANGSPACPTQNEIPSGTTLGGYEVLHKLGSGGMGAVYLARQVSLDRNVALKTLHQQLATDAQLVSRFTREAYAAAQLSHHNIVQIHDIGQDKQINFFSMEFVSGKTLANVLQEAGKLDPETAVSYVLQAARGLKFAHDHGLIHRDIKPENLLLNDQGIVKVADLGLVKKVGSHETENAQQVAANDSGVAVTQINKSMGTPLYMPPEQAVDAARVDHRADIYSLGCTLYHLVTGRPPFTGRTAMEVITKHQHEPVTPPDVIVKDVPANLSPIIVRMLAKRPEDRYASMKDVIDALEGFLGIASSGPYTPKEEQVKILEFAVEQYNKTFWTKLRPKLIMGFYAACVLLGVLMAYVGDGITWKINLVGGVVGLAVLTTLAYQITLGVLQGTYLFRKVRQLVFGAGILDWLLWIAGVGIFGFVIYSFGLHWPWLLAAILAVMLSQAFYWGVDYQAARSREKYLKQAEHLIKQMRLKGLDENAIRQFVCKFAGRHWEEFFENLFGYEAKLQARQVWGKERGKDRPKFAAWREPLIHYIDYRIESRKQLREAKLLAKLEAKAMQAKGISEKLAAKQAKKNAQRLISTAEVIKREINRSLAATLAPPGEPTLVPSGIKETAPAMSKTSLAMSVITSGTSEDEHHKNLESMPGYVRHGYLRRRYGTPMQILTSSMLRLAMGLILLTVYANWWNMNHGQSVLSTANEILTTRQEDKTIIASQKEISTATVVRAVEATAQADEKPLIIPMVPKSLTEPIKPSALLVAGSLLLLGIFFRGTWLGLGMYLAAAVALAGYLVHLPVIGYPSIWMAYLAAVGIWVFSIIFLRAQTD